MLLKLNPHPNNEFPLQGIMIEGDQLMDWLREIQRMQLSLDQLEVYPISGTTANTVWGCLLTGKMVNSQVDIGKNSFCQLVEKCLFIPEKALLFPKVSRQELSDLFRNRLHIMHPIIGLTELGTLLDWTSFIVPPQQADLVVKAPKKAMRIPIEIKSFHIQAVSVEEVLENLENNTFPNQQKLENEPLNLAEKTRLAFYRQLFEKTGGKNAADDETKISPLMGILSTARSFFSDDTPKWTDEMRQDFEGLEKRSQNQLDRLMEMLKENPDEALKYAIPLDNKGTNRGGYFDGETGGFDLFERWSNFSLFGNHQQGESGGGTGMISDDSYARLNQQYREAARALIEKGEYKKAAFIYMKLLKEYDTAARTLEDGGLYQEAASVYLKYNKNKSKAAECYEKGRLFKDAIALYKELKQDEKVGDLYLEINQRASAMHYYQQVVDYHCDNRQYLKASRICRHKMDDVTAAQRLLLQGWEANIDAYNCLNNYFNAIEDTKLLRSEIQRIYSNDVTTPKQVIFLTAIKHEYKRYVSLKPFIKEIAYKIIVDRAQQHHDVVGELQFFNKKDQQLHKDISRFKVERYKR